MYLSYISQVNSDGYWYIGLRLVANVGFIRVILSIGSKLGVY